MDVASCRKPASDPDAAARAAPASATLLPALQQGLLAAAPALYWRGQAIQRATLRTKVLLLTRQFAAAGINRGAVVAVLLPRCPEVLVVLLALWQRGAAYLPLDPAWPAARIEAALQTAAAGFLVTQADLQGRCTHCSCALLLLPAGTQWQEDTGTAAEPATDAASWPEATDTAYLLFTSGSTGAPKAVQVSHGALQVLFSGLLPLLALQPPWRLLGCSALCFDIVFFEWLAPLLGGGSLVLADDASQGDAGRLLQLVRQHAVDVIQATPSLWRLLLQQRELQPRQLQLAIATGEALDLQTASRLLALELPLWNLYGPTECTLWCSAHRVLPRDLAPTEGHCISIGRPLPGYHFRLLPHPDTAGLVDSGELLISGHGVADGYLGAAPDQQQRFTPTTGGGRRFRSGDLCRRDADGNFHFLQRCDSQLKLNGYRIEAGEIEARLRSHPGIRDAACLARRVDAGTQLLACVVCAAGSPNKDRERWNRHLAQWLPEWMLPQRYLIVEALPLDTNGKLDRRALLQLAERACTGTSATADTQTRPDLLASTDALESSVMAIFLSVLEIETIGPCDSFFDLGGNSMLAATLLLATNQHFGSQLRLRELLQAPPTVQRVTALLRRAGVTIPPA